MYPINVNKENNNNNITRFEINSKWGKWLAPPSTILSCSFLCANLVTIKGNGRLIIFGLSFFSTFLALHVTFSYKNSPFISMLHVFFFIVGW